MVGHRAPGALRMRSIILGSTLRARFFAAVAMTAAACVLAGCGGGGIPTLNPASEHAPSKETLSMLGRKGMDAGSPIFVRIFKEESELEVWKARDDGRFYHLKHAPTRNCAGNVGHQTTLR